MRSVFSVRALANNIADPNIRDALQKIDQNQQEMHAAVTRLSRNEEPNTSGKPIVVVQDYLVDYPNVELAGAYDYLTIADQVITLSQIDLTTDVTGDLPLANLAQSSAASRLLGRGSASGAGDFQEISLGTNLAMSGTTLSVSGRQKSMFFPPAVWTGKATSNIGTLPTATQVIDFVHNLDAYITTTILIPPDINTSASYNLKLYYAPAGTDTNLATFEIYGKILDPTVDLINGTNDDNLSQNVGPSGTAYEVHSEDITAAIDGIIAASKVIRLSVGRAGAGDANADSQYFLGVALNYTTL